MRMNNSNDCLKHSIELFFVKLGKSYPDHEIPDEEMLEISLRLAMNMIYKKIGYKTASKFLADYGYRFASDGPAKNIVADPEAKYTVVAAEVLRTRLEKYYPDKVIVSSLRNSYPALMDEVCCLYRKLGYSDIVELLTGFGYEVRYESCSNGGFFREVIELLKEKYGGDRKARDLKDIYKQNPELSEKLSIIEKDAKDLFGMGLGDYLKKLGLIEKQSGKAEQTELRNYIEVSVKGMSEPMLCYSKRTSAKVGDRVLLKKIDEDDYLMGVVKKTIYGTSMSVDTVYAYKRKLKVPQESVFSDEYFANRHLFCKVRINENECYCYTSPTEDIRQGDIVEVVDDVSKVYETVCEYGFNAPLPSSEDYKIKRVIRRPQKEKEEAELAVKDMAEQCGTKPVSAVAVSERVRELYESSAHFTNAVFRGLAPYVIDALMEFYPDDMDPISRGTELGSEVIQFECDSEKVPQMLKAHPELKAVFFAEHFETGEVYLAYSESGYPTVTDIRLVGYCDQNVKDKWMQHLDPTQDFYNRLDARYLFLERARWESLDYALRDGKSRLAGGKVIPSRPYKREPFYISPQRLINGLVKKFGTEPFTEPPVNAEAEEIYNLAEYFASAVFRGYEFEVDKALSEIYQVNEDWLPQKIKLGDGIAQFACPSELVPKFVKKYPCMKAIFFAEDWRAEEMYLAYSESGCPTVSDIRHVGIFIADRECRFGLMHDPTEEAFDEPECEYVFIEKPRWEKYDYALPNRRRKLTGGKVIPSMPYKKDPFSTQCEIIEIRYPENEIFYEGYKESGCD